MFLSFFIPAGGFLLIAAKRPSEHRSMIALTAWWNISHGAVMAIQMVEAWIHSVHRNFTNVIIPCDRSCPVSASQQNERQLRRELRERIFSRTETLVSDAVPEKASV